MTALSAAGNAPVVESMSRDRGLLWSEHWYLLAALAMPKAAAHPDLQQAFHSNRRWFFGFLIGLLVVSLLKDLLIAGALPERSNLLFHAGAALAAMLGIAIKHERVHQLLAYSTVLIIMLYIGLLFTRLP